MTLRIDYLKTRKRCKTWVGNLMKNKNLGFLDVWNEETEQKIDSRIAWLKEHPEEGRKIMEELEKNLEKIAEVLEIYGSREDDVN